MTLFNHLFMFPASPPNPSRRLGTENTVVHKPGGAPTLVESAVLTGKQVRKDGSENWEGNMSAVTVASEITILHKTYFTVT